MRRNCVAGTPSKEHFIYTRCFAGTGHVFVTVSVRFQFWACKTAIQAHMFRALLRSRCPPLYAAAHSVIKSERDKERKTCANLSSGFDSGPSDYESTSTCSLIYSFPLSVFVLPNVSCWVAVLVGQRSVLGNVAGHAVGPLLRSIGKKKQIKAQRT